jgi:membrane protease YdiL (CAAX protease family)
LGFVVGQVLAILFVALEAVTFSNKSFDQLLKGAQQPWYVVVASLVGIWVADVVVVLWANHGNRLIPRLSMRQVRWSDAKYIIVGWALQFLVTLLYLPFHLQHLSRPTQRLFGDAHGVALLVVALLTILGAPIFEEFVYRGVLLSALRSLISDLPRRGALIAAIVLDGLIFGLIHGEWVQLPGLALTGMTLASIYAYERRLAPSIITHMSFNSVAVFFVFLQRVHGS